MIIIGLIVILIVIWLIATYNKFIRMQNKVEEGFSTMDVYLKKRYDLIPNLVETIKGYTKHESETLEKVMQARNMAVNSKTVDEKISNEKNFQTMLGPLYAIAEQYPNLKADTQFSSLQSELKSIESEIANSRKYYNAVCVKFNTMTQVFPKNLVAGLFHFTKKPLFEITDTEQRENVKVQF